MIDDRYLRTEGEETRILYPIGSKEEIGERKRNEMSKREDKFNNLLERRFKKIRDTLQSKAITFASPNNRLHDFDVAARILNCTPEQALLGMMLKHFVSVLDLVEWSETMPECITEQLVDEKIGDTINYLLLLEILFFRRIEKDKSHEPRTKDRGM